MHLLLLVIIYLAFISLGLPDSVHGLAWPSLRHSLGQSLEALGLVSAVLTACSALSGFVSGRVLSRFGTGRVTFASALMTGLSLFAISFVPAFPWLVVLAFPLGLGAGAVDAGLNHFVAEHYSSRHMNWLHACWGVGATLGPLIMGASLAGSWTWAGGYRTIGLMQLGLAAILFISLPWWRKQPLVAHTDETGGPDAKPIPGWAPYVAALLFALYVGIEGGVGLWLASVLVEERQGDPSQAALAVTLYYGSIMAGRVLAGLVSLRLGNRRLILGGLLLAMAGLALFILRLNPALDFGALVAIGLGCAPIFPGLMHETPRRFDRGTTRKVIGWQMAAAYIGAATIPPALGLLGAQLGLWLIFPSVLGVALILLAASRKLDRVT